MKLHRGIGLVLIAGALLLGGASGHAQTPLDSPITQSAAEALAEAQMRRQFEESKRLFPRRAPEDVHAMIEREGRRAGRNLSVLAVICLIMFFLFALPLSEREKVVASDQPVDEAPSHREV